jgi:hypothetical protein
MLGRLRNAIGRVLEKWHLFWALDCGQRFQTRYHSHRRRRREQGETPKWVSLLNLVGGPALIVAGFAFLPTPGPSYIIIVIGMWMLAGEWLPLARIFDWLEVRLRHLGRSSKGRWRRFPAGIKGLVILACVGALGYVAYYLVFGG